VFVEELLNKPVPAPLVFEVLRCVGVEENGNNPNKYYYLRQLKAKGLVEENTSAKSEAEYFYSATELGKKVAKLHAFFKELVGLRDKILNDEKVKKLVEVYSQRELSKSNVPNLIRRSKVVKEDEKGIKVKLYDGKSYINVTWAELEQMDSTAKELGTFSHLELMKKSNMSDFKARAYLVYAYERGLIDIVDRVDPKFIYRRLNVG
jgi:DNA-binding PadR family transcriptional regulator